SNSTVSMQRTYLSDGSERRSIELTPPYMSQPWSSEDTIIHHEHHHEKEHRPPVAIIEAKKERSYSLITKCFAEFLGDLIFVFTGSMQGYINTNMDSILHAAFAHGIAIFVLVTSLGHISGGHFNPAVSLGGTLTGHLPLHHLPLYVVSQLLGGICGSLMTYAVLTKEEFTAILGGATLLTQETTTWYEGLISESMVTFMLVHTVLNAAMGSGDKPLAPLAIGFTLTIDIIATGRLTGASMNPARSLGPNLIGWAFMDTIPFGWWEYHYIYWAGPIIGACIASAVYWVFERREKRICP
ncbi:hypothetical protein PFISCL1PPCAC_2389, partial [Pristionchus fissidentatus]